MRISALPLLLLIAVANAAPAPTCRQAPGGSGDPSTVAAALGTLQALLGESQRAALEKPLSYESAIRWSNLPVGVVPRTGLRLGDLDARQMAAARQVFEAAL